MEKNYNLLGEQLAESGLEMSIFGAISAVASVAGGIFGASQADKQNKAAEEAYEEQKEAAEEAAKLTNEYNKKVFEADKLNYQNTRKYEYETALRQWQYNQSIQDYQYLQSIRQYGQSVENTEQQLSYNSIAANEAYNAEMTQLDEVMLASQLASSSEMAILKEQALATDIQTKNELGALADTYAKGSLDVENQLGSLAEALQSKNLQAANQQGLFNQALREDAFKRQGLMIDSLAKQGKVQLGQAGRSRAKGMQSTIADLGRNASLLSSALTSTAEQTQRNLQEIDFNYAQARGQVGRNISDITLSLTNASNQVQRNLRDINFNYDSTAAQTGRNIKDIQLSFASAVGQAGRNLRDISTQRYGADMRARASMMLRPEKLQDIPEPTQAPERIFVEPMKATAAYIPPARQQSVFQPLISGLATAAPQLAQAFKPIVPKLPGE